MKTNIGKTLIHTACIFTLLTASSVWGRGVIALKDQPHHPDAGANVVAYSQISDGGGPAVKISSGGRSIPVERSKIAGRVEIPDAIPQDIKAEADVAYLRRSLREMEGFTTRFPRSAPILASSIEAVQMHIGQFDSGMVRHQGEWMTKKQYSDVQAAEKARLAKVQAEKKAREAAAKEAEIARLEEQREKREKEEAYAKAQRAKGLELHNGQWLPRETVAVLQKQEREDSVLEAEVDKRSLGTAFYRVIQVGEDFMLVRILNHTKAAPGVNTDLVMLYESPKGEIAEGDTDTNELYWCGTQTYKAKSGDNRTVHAYCFDKERAKELRRRIRAKGN